MSLWLLWRNSNSSSHRCIRVQAEDAYQVLSNHKCHHQVMRNFLSLKNKKRERERDLNSFEVYEQQQEESQTNEQ